LNRESIGVALAIENLDFMIDDIQILKNINLRIGKGEFTGLIGPNGAGKTSLLKCINGINKGSGTIRIGDSELKDLNTKAVARKVALMHQNTSVSFPFPVIDVVLTGRYPHLKRMRGETAEDYRIARKYMEYTGTAEFEERPITGISGGERQRVFFAKVLAQETGLVLLDEPTASLDIAYEEQIFKYCAQLCKDGKTVIAAVHDIKTACRYCTRLVLMKKGEIVADGSPEEVMTSENLSESFGVSALVYRNRITGSLDFYIHGLEHKGTGRRVHVIGGGGSAAAVIRLLFENGFKVTAGVFAHGDSDLNCAEIFGIEFIACKPFTGISRESIDENIRKIKEADFAVLCNMPFGVQNLGNLEAARHAERLIVIEDDPPESRDYTGGEALKLYEILKKNAVVTAAARLHEVI
jgi:iron complex transport system ATP-binding protein